jgi:hypothetical protein
MYIFRTTRNSVFLVYQQLLTSVVARRVIGKMLDFLQIQSYVYLEAVLAGTDGSFWGFRGTGTEHFQ